MENQNIPPQNPSNPVQLPQLGNSEYTKFDKKTIDTIKYSAIWGGVAMIIKSLAGSLTVYYLVKSLYSNIYSQMGVFGNYLGNAYAPKMINPGALLNDIIWGIVGGAIAGYVIAKFYPVFMRWQKNLTGNKLNTLFKILFWPYLVASLVLMFLEPGFSRAGFKFVAIIAIADIIAVFIYARMMEKNVGKYYR